MMTDRELLEAAAKAAGIEIDWIDPVWNNPEAVPYIHLPSGRLWNPLTDDGDALRLAVKLRLDISIFHDGSVCVSATTDEDPFGVELADEMAADHRGDSCAATRRAIVRAAAAVADAAGAA
jgi:hypothetical protein